jgi:hypothetical protein
MIPTAGAVLCIPFCLTSVYVEYLVAKHCADGAAKQVFGCCAIASRR